MICQPCLISLPNVAKIAVTSCRCQRRPRKWLMEREPHALRPSCANLAATMGDLLRPVTAADSAEMLRWRNDAHVRRHVFEQDVIPKDVHSRWLDGILIDDTRAYFVFEQNGVACGIVGLTEIDRIAGSANWGFYTAPNAPKGSGTAMLRLALNHAFGPMGLRRINAEVLGFNTASLHLHDKLGFVRTGLRQRHQLGDGTFHDVVLFAKTRATKT